MGYYAIMNTDLGDALMMLIFFFVAFTVLHFIRKKSDKKKRM